jgi:capsule biosynthesis phosphatase
MKYILLCGDSGKRTHPHSLPKPLNYIYGRHMIEYLIENIPSDEIYILYHPFLDEYQFQTILRNKCKHKTIHFSAVEYATRGAVETAYIGIQSLFTLLSSSDENLVFIDDDNLHTFPENIPVFEHDFIGYSDSVEEENPNETFLCTDPQTGWVIDIAEKQKISDHYCCGFYGFKNLPHFLSLAKELLDTNEFYFSQLYKYALQQERIIQPFYIQHTQHLGNYEEILSQSLIPHYDPTAPSDSLIPNAKIHKKKLRFCFDLDNTLVSYPTVPGYYSTVQPITKMIKTVRQLKQEGHEIIIYTARRMATHYHSVGKVMRDIGMLTMKTLEDLDIPYDELIFGKPKADIYVDDRAVNPYSQSLSYFGFFMQEEDFLPNKVKNNEYTHVERRQQEIWKMGPKRFMQGELFYYQHIPESLKRYFPVFLGGSEIRDVQLLSEGAVVGKTGEESGNEEKLQLRMEYIQGIPLYYLYKNQLLTTRHIDQIFEMLDKFHSYKIERGCGEYIQREDVMANYDSTIAELHRFDEVVEMVEMIHGDFGFSNVLLTYGEEDQYKCIDMRGQVNGKLTLGGDRYYDYGKMYQSILGYDLILNGIAFTEHWKEYRRTIETHFWKKIEDRGKSIEYTKAVTKSLLFSAFHSLKDLTEKSKTNIMRLIENI